ncbi:hypothetical protein GLOTRDRAFT_26631, partial [Gloeophyllum trabeum ATCC 11539]
PSRGWLQRPAWIDGAVNPPQFYVTAEQIQLARANAFAVLRRVQHDAESGQNARGTHSEGLRFVQVQFPQPAQGVGRPTIDDILPVQRQHLVSVTLQYTSVEKGPAARGSKVVSKKVQVNKFEKLVLDKMTRNDFVRAVLKVHDLSDSYAPGDVSGPAFRLWWQGSSGGKSGAGTIDTDREFTIALGAIVKKRGCAVNVEINLDNMEGFRVRPRIPQSVGPEATNDDEELLGGAGIPRVESFPDEAQLHGGIILELKRLHECKEHLGEHGETGYCYKNENGHIGLNNRRLKIWAAAIVQRHAKHSSGSSPPATPRKRHARSRSSSPPPPPDMLLHSFLVALKDRRGIDFLAVEPVLAAKEITPDIIHRVPVDTLCNMMNSVEGRVLKMVDFAEEWNPRSKGKRARR